VPSDFERYLATIYEAMWKEGANLGDPAVLATTLAAAGFDAEAFAALVGDPEVKARLVATTEEAVRRGVFGAPTFFVGDEMFFGQDRLDFVAEALAARARLARPRGPRGAQVAAAFSRSSRSKASMSNGLTMNASKPVASACWRSSGVP
jgi:hypothetical protein